MRSRSIYGSVKLSVWMILAGVWGHAIVSGDIVINEIHYNPDVKTELVEFVELHNSGGESIDLSGWSLAEGVVFTFPEATALVSGGYVIVAENPQALKRKFGVAALGPWSGKLSNEGDRVTLRDRAGALVDQVNYQPGFPWPTVGDPPGNSIQLIHPALDNDLGGSWRSSISSASAGSAEWLIPDHSEWRYFKGVQEASSPVSAWRAVGFDDSRWATGVTPIGYGENFLSTVLSDMRGGYSTVFLRKTFRVATPGDVGGLELKAQFDDGFNVWINGQHVLGQNVASEEIPFNGSAVSALESLDFHTFVLPLPSSYLVAGPNVIAVQGHNASLNGSSDSFFDFRLRSISGSSQKGPTPGKQNSVFSDTQPPQVRQVNHRPEEPRSNEPVVVSAKITDPDGISKAELLFQIVDPGAYIELSDPAFQTNWQRVAMNDSGRHGDAASGDDEFTATLPASTQYHRRLVRYRISATDAVGETVVVPYGDDPQPNFAYFVYDGVPGWQAAVRPGSSAVVTYSPEVMGRLPVYHLISKKASVESSTWRERYGGDQYKWSGTLVYDGEVYDHIHYRARGGVWRYAMGKNMWKFDFNRGHSFQARDDYGSKYKSQWAKLNLGASIQQGDYLHRGEHGMFESVGFRLFNLMGVEAPRTSFVTFRVVDDAVEANPSNQYDGDFWGVYLATEQMDGRFLEEHDLPDGNLFKMENGTGPSGANGELNHQGAFAVSDYSDLIVFRRDYENVRQPDDWWRSNLDLRRYYSYQSVIQGIHHYDVCCGKNYFYYQNPQTGLWQVHPWDLDLTWADNMYVAGVTGGTEPFQSRVLPRPAFAREYKNRVREFRDLLFNEDQAWQLIDEYAALLQGPADGPTILDADRSQWDYNPVMNDRSIVNTGKAGQGRYYQKGTPTKNFAGMVRLMKDYVTYRSGRILDPAAADANIPPTPEFSGRGGVTIPINQLQIRSPSFLGPVGSPGADPRTKLRWRVGEVSDSNSPAFDPNKSRRYEIEALWETPFLTREESEVTIPPTVFEIGHRYRIRAQLTDSEGRTSHWSKPIEFTAGEPDTANALMESLQLTELMHNPTGGGDFEFIELHNSSASVELDLSGAIFTRGIDFSFPPGTKILPGGYLLLVRADLENKFANFRAHYGLGPSALIVGPYSGNLANDGERLTLRTAASGSALIDLTYQDGLGWPPTADGEGHSLVPVAPSAISQRDGILNAPGNWRASANTGGSPGRIDPGPGEPTGGGLRFLSVALTGAGVVLIFKAEALTSYTVESSDSLLTGGWSVFQEVAQQSESAEIRVTDSLSKNGGAKFYRVVGRTSP